jgi:2-iminobutanoate/2-iminopropanoate deaminase
MSASNSDHPMIQALSSPRLPKPRFLYSPVIRAGDWILFSGMVALDPASGALEQGGPGPETKRILANLVASLPDFDLTLNDLASARIFTTRWDEFPAINAAWQQALAHSPTPPARTSVGVVALPLGATVEIEFVFYKELRRE